MPITTVTFPGQSFEARQAPTHAVYSRANWADDWELESGLHCDEAVWSVSPSIATATITSDWGQIATEHAVKFAAAGRTTDLRDRYVKIVFNLELTDSVWSTKIWYGVCRVQEDTASGQRWTCYGLEVLLAEHIVRDSWWRRTTEAAEQIERGLTFNRGGKPNKSIDTWVGGIHYFGSDPGTNLWWSSSDVAKYLLGRQTPLDRFGEVMVPFRLSSSAPVGLPPSWDRPELATHGLSTLDLLGQLLPRQRLVGFYLSVDETLTPHNVIVNPFSFTRDEILVELADAKPLPANADLYELDFTASPETLYSLKLSTIERFDQVIARGARRRACFSVSVTDANLEAGWTAAAETEYEAAASNAGPAYDNAGVAERERMNIEVRGGVRLRDVFARFQIPRDWDGQAGNGQGGDKYAVFNLGGPGTSAYPGGVYDLELELEPTLPLLEGVDYGGDAIPLGTFDESDATGQEMAAAVWWKIPNTARWAPVDTLGRAAEVEEEASTENHKWSATVSVEQYGRGLRLDVAPEPQHVVAETDFTPLANCNDQDLGDNDWREMIATVSVREDRYAEGRWPAAADGVPDIARTMVIDAGEAYQLNLVSRNTIVDVDDDAALVESSGGYTRDDRDKLEAIARIAYAWYGQTRRVLTLQTAYLGLGATVGLGDFVTAFATTVADGDSDDPAEEFYSSREVGSVITELAIETPRIGPGITDAPTLRIVTTTGELDALLSGADLDELEVDGMTPQVVLEDVEAENDRLRKAQDWQVGSL